MAEQARFDMPKREWLLQQRIVVEIDLPDREVICRTPVGIQLAQHVGFKNI